MEYLFYVKEQSDFGDTYYALYVVPELHPESVEEAIELSIQKWRSIVYLTERGFKIRADGGPSTCGLCVLFHSQERPCYGCPIRERTRIDGCQGTSHEYWEIAVGIHYESGLEEAKGEIRFLESLKGE